MNSSDLNAIRVEGTTYQISNIFPLLKRSDESGDKIIDTQKSTAWGVTRKIVGDIVAEVVLLVESGVVRWVRRFALIVNRHRRRFRILRELAQTPPHLTPLNSQCSTRCY